MSLAGGEAEPHGQSVGVNHGVDFAGQSASRAAHVLFTIFRDGRSMLMHADNGRIDHLHGRIMSHRQAIHDPIPDTGPSPANEAIVASCVGSVGLRQIAPWRTWSQDPKDAIEDAPVVHPWHAAWLVGEHRLDDTPLIVIEFISHDSRLQFGALNHGQRAAINRGPRCPSLPKKRTFADITRATQMTQSGHPSIG